MAHVVGGTTARVVGVAGVLLGNVAGLANTITPDLEYQQRLQLLRQRHPKTTRQGVRLGLEALKDGFASGSAGVVRAPLEGARADGAVGFVLGLQRGIQGLFTKPLAGAAVFAVKATEGVSSDVMRVTHAQVVDQHVRMRQPRLLGTGQQARLLPYPRLPPVAADSPPQEAEAGEPANGQTPTADPPPPPGAG